MPEDAPVWAQATSTRDNCLGQSCPDYADCFVMRARRNALAADVVVVNHHLFFADLVLRDEGISELLPACNTVIFDEAHQLPETARMFFGESVSTRQLIELARDVRLELRAAGGASPELERVATRLEKAARDLRLAFGEAARAARLAPGARACPDFADALHRLQFGAADAGAALAAQAGRSEGLGRLRAPRERGASPARAAARDRSVGDEVRWVEVFGHAVQLHVDAAVVRRSCSARQMDDHPRAWIFTSATLAVGEDFSHFTRELGVARRATAALGEPVRLRRAGAALRAEGAARSRTSRASPMR